MPYFLYSRSQERRVSESFATEKDMWTHVQAQGLCGEVIDREDMDPRRILSGLRNPFLRRRRPSRRRYGYS